MSTSPWTISSIFQPASNPTIIKRKDSATSDIVTQLSNFKGFGEKGSIPRATIPVTITFTPSIGSTVLSLYPRTKTFTYISSTNDVSCIANTSDGQAWRITHSATSSDKTNSGSTRFTFERLSADKAEAPLEVFKNCAVKMETLARRGSSADFGRKLSVGHFSSGLSGFMLPLSPVA